MTHVTVVQVQESHLRQVSKDVRTISDPLASTDTTDNSLNNTGHVGLQVHSQNDEFKTDMTNSEVMYVNVMELRQQGAVNITQTGMTSPAMPLNSQSLSHRTLAKTSRNRRLSRKSSIMNQNVGVTGGVFMKSDPKFQPLEYSDDESDASLSDESESSSSSALSLSGSDSGLSSTIEVGMSPPPRHSTTITIGNEHCSSEKGILLHVSPKAIESSSEEEEEEEKEVMQVKSKDISTTGHHDEVISVEYSNFEVSEDLSEAAVTLEWRVIPPTHPVLRQHIPLELEGDRGSTPTSFSSAYTVTENESTSEESEVSRHNWSSQESDEDIQDSRIVLGGQFAAEKSSPSNDTRRQNEISDIIEINIARGSPSDDESLLLSSRKCTQVTTLERHIVPTISEDLVKEAVLSTMPSVLRRLRHVSGGSCSSGEESIVYSYIPCRDQREKEDEELWVANEAADPRGAQVFQGTTPPLIPPPMGWGGSLGRVAGKTQQQQQSNSTGGVVWSEQPPSADDCGKSPTCVKSIMCTVAPTITSPSQVGGPSAPRKHYSNRQRAAETQVIKFKVVDEESTKYRENWSKLSDTEKKQSCEGSGNNMNLPTSVLTCKPTKRFSFLVRSNSTVKEGDTQQQQNEQHQQQRNEAPTTSKSEEELQVHKASSPDTQHLRSHPLHHGKKLVTTPSDQAILDKLATLKIETPAEVSSRTRPRCSPFDPPCARCGEPVYPQERTEPTLRLVFHSSCFKCHHCGVRLSLKTFFRSPLDSKDTRIFCRSHVPTLDPGKLDASRTDSATLSSSSSTSSLSPSSGKSSPDCLNHDIHSDTSRTSGTSPATCLQQQLEIVKCDTIGLRYF